MDHISVIEPMAPTVPTVPTAPTVPIQVKPPYNVEREKDAIEDIGQGLVRHGLLTNEEAHEQTSAIKKFMDGKMSYAEMRMIAG
jgi:hypothetical protein